MTTRPSKANVMTVTLESGVEVCLSYGVPVAAFVPGRGFVKTDRHYSRTTSKHANQYARQDAKVLDDATFRALVAPITGDRR
jgi:hypothetical protein